MSYPSITVLTPWKASGSPRDPAGRLRARVNVGMTVHILEAIAVTGRDPQEAEDYNFQETFEYWSAASGGDGPFETVEIDGRDYAVFMSPVT